MDSEQLYFKCRQYDEEAWEYVYNYVLIIARWPRWNLHDSPEDMAQSILEFLLEKGMHKAQKPASFKAFIKQVAVRKILDSFKKKKMATSEYFPEMEYNDKIPPEMDANAYGHLADQTISKDFIYMVSKILTQLPEYCSHVIPQYFKYKLGIIETFKELAEVVGSPTGTVSAQLTRCLRRLAQSPELIAYYKEN